MKRIPYGRHNITQEDLDAVNETLLSDFITQGARVGEFEVEFARFIGCKHAIAVNNGTAALDISVKAMGIKANDKVITTPITFAASANAVRFSGGEIIFSDIDRETYLLDLNKLEHTLKKNSRNPVRAVIPVDFAGNPVNLEELTLLAGKYDFRILEDACHAPGGGFMDSSGMIQNCGNGIFAELAIFSFHPVKHITTGEGGMVTTNDDDLFEKLLLYRSHGITRDEKYLTENHGGWYYEMLELSHNFRLTDFQAALGNSQLKRLDKNLERRREIAAEYDKAFSDIEDIKTQRKNPADNHAFHLYVIEVPDRKDFYDYLIKNGIFAQVHYIPLHLMPYYRQFGWKHGDFPVAEDYYKHCISLPIYPTLGEKDLSFVIGKVQKYFHH